MTIPLYIIVPALRVPIMSLVFQSSSSLKRLGLSDFFIRVFSLLLVHFVFHVFTEVLFKSYLG